MAETFEDLRSQIHILAAWYWFNEAQDMYVYRTAHHAYGWERATRDYIRAGVILLSRIPITDIPEMALVLAWDDAAIRAPIIDDLPAGQDDSDWSWNGAGWIDHCFNRMTPETKALIAHDLTRQRS